MKKIIEKDKKTRLKIKNFEKKKLILKSIFLNENFFNLMKWNANALLIKLPNNSSKTLITNKCISTIHKKKFNNLTNLSRIVFLKLVKSRHISNMYKSSW